MLAPADNTHQKKMAFIQELTNFQTADKAHKKYIKKSVKKE